MISRARGAGFVLVAMLLAAPACFAAEADSAAAKPRSGHLPGRGAVGFQMGGGSFVSGGDYKAGAQIARLAFAGHYRYVISRGLRWQISPYMTWAAYEPSEPVPFADPNFPADLTKDQHLTILAGGSGQLQWVTGNDPWRWHVGAGPALYRVWVQNRRKVLKDPETFRLHQGLYLGATAEVGVERFLKSLPNTSLEFTVGGHMALARRDEQFPRGYNDSPIVVDARFGAHYYYDFKRKKPDTPSALPKP